MSDKCPICKSTATSKDLGGGPHVDCTRCGRFKLSDFIASPALNLKPADIAKLSGWIRENQNASIDEARFRSLLELSPPSVGEKADKLLRLLARLFPKVGDTFFLTRPDGLMEWGMANRRAGEMALLLGATWSQDETELSYLWDAYLLAEVKFLAKSQPSDGHCAISPKGWDHLYSLNHGTGTGHTGFIALWFDPSINPASAAIESAITAAGYSPLRIDKHQHNNKIDDEIIAGIRRSKFLVADFTGQRGGVYFEAGFAMGLGRPVIWLCRQDEIGKIHFDNRQYNFILWEATKLDELKSALQNRIEATMGRGPLSALPAR